MTEVTVFRKTYLSVNSEIKMCLLIKMHVSSKVKALLTGEGFVRAYFWSARPCHVQKVTSCG